MDGVPVFRMTNPCGGQQPCGDFTCGDITLSVGLHITQYKLTLSKSKLQSTFSLREYAKIIIQLRNDALENTRIALIRPNHCKYLVTEIRRVSRGRVKLPFTKFIAYTPNVDKK